MIDKTAKTFNSVNITGSALHRYCAIGDFSVIHNSTISSYVNINRRCEIYNSIIGNRSYVGVNSVIKSATIGSYCSLSWNLSIGGKNHDYDNLTTHPKWRFHRMDETLERIKPNMGESSSCVIGSDVWIGSNVVVLRNVHIGHGAIIGAGSVVTKSMPPYSIAVGNPAKIIKLRFNQAVIDDLVQIKWWDWPDDLIRKNLDIIYDKKVNIPLINELKRIAKQL